MIAPGIFFRYPGLIKTIDCGKLNKEENTYANFGC